MYLYLYLYLRYISKVSSPTLPFSQTKQSPVLKYLSPIVRDFSPSLLKPFVDISPESVATELTAWLDGVHEVVTSLTAAVLAHVASVEAVATIRYIAFCMVGVIKFVS